MADLHAVIGSGTKILRYMLQSALLGIGAYLVLSEQASGGIIIASSIMMGRALAPIDVVLSTWKQLVAAREGVGRLRDILKATASPTAPAVTLPRPNRQLSVRNLTIAAPGSDRIIVSGVSFALSSGSGLAVLGASASGKSTLIRALVGVWPAVGGEVSLDHAALDQWKSDDLGRHIGYLPQDVALLDGTVAENIARFDEAAPSDRILQAARAAGAHDMIVRLPEGYSTRIGESGSSLSAGQRQRLGLARAIFGNPFLVVLDEPNANLDADGERALAKAVDTLRNEGSIVIVVSHRSSALAVLDMALVMHEGKAVVFGTHEEVAKRMTGSTIPKVGVAARADAPYRAHAPYSVRIQQRNDVKHAIAAE